MAIPHANQIESSKCWHWRANAIRSRFALLGAAVAVLVGCQALVPTSAVPVPGVEQAQPADRASVEVGLDAALRSLDAAETLAAAGQWTQASEALAEAFKGLAHSLSGDRARLALNDRVWRLTATAPWGWAAAHAGTQDELAALWSLRAAIDDAFSVADKAAQLEQWRRRWPRHPLSVSLPRALKQLPQSAFAPGPAALFVPLDGVLAPAGKAVRDGFVSAYLHDAAAVKARVRIYDSTSESISRLYQRALADGAKFIVGPIDRAALETLYALKPKVPVLGLNYLSVPPRDNFRTVGLAIEDEVATIIRRLAHEGRERVLVIHNSQEWARRGAATLAENWPHHMEQQGFSDIKAMTEAVGEALRVAASQARHAELERVLGASLGFLPRTRKDIDAVVAFVGQLEARALSPAMKFHFAEGLPVYASSQSVRNATEFDRAEAFHVVETPFRLRSSPLHSAFAEAFDFDVTNLASLFALGVDAYRLMNHWRLLSLAEPLVGATGTLILQDDGRIRRTLVWAEVFQGQLRADSSVYAGTL